jgi:hypothetical protein
MADARKLENDQRIGATRATAPVDEPIRWLLGDGRSLVLEQRSDLFGFACLTCPRR